MLSTACGGAGAKGRECWALGHKLALPARPVATTMRFLPGRFVRGLFVSGDLWGHALQTAASDAALSFLGLATGVFAARLLGPVGRGELAAIQTWPTFIATLSTLGLGEAIVYYAAQEPEQGGRFIGSALVLALVAAPPFMAVSYFLMPYLLAAQSPGVVFASRCYLLLIPVYVALSMPVQGIRAKKKFGIWNVLRALSPLCWLLVLGIAWALGQSRFQSAHGSRRPRDRISDSPRR